MCRVLCRSILKKFWWGVCGIDRAALLKASLLLNVNQPPSMLDIAVFCTLSKTAKHIYLCQGDLLDEAGILSRWSAWLVR